jgi:hypothetical protein
MPETGESAVYRLESNSAVGQLRYRSAGGDGRRILDIARYQGPALPASLTSPVVERSGEPDVIPESWRIICAEGQFEFTAQAVAVMDEQPALYEALHRPFSLSTADRLALRVLLWILRLPGGAGLLRRWHAHRH